MGGITQPNNRIVGPVGINTNSPTEALEIGSSLTQQNRLKLTSYFETDSAGTAELIRLFYANALNMQGNSSKASIAWFDENSPSFSKVWVQSHLYLHYYNTYTFAPGAVNTSTSQINVPAYGYPIDGWQVQFSSTGTLPAPLVAATNYYVKKVDNDHFTVYSDSGLTSQVTLTTQGTGTHTITPNLAYNNNQHQHFSIEVTNSDGQTKNTRFSIPFDLDTTEIGFFQSNVSVNSGIFRVVGGAGSNRQIGLSNTLSSELTPDGTEKRWIIEADSTAEGGANAGSNFEILAYSDTGASPATRLFIRRSAAQIGLSGNTNPGADLDIGVGSAGGSTVSSRLNRGTTAQFASFIWDTAGSDQWSLQMRNDSTNDLHFRDNINGRTHIHLLQSSGITQLAAGLATTLVTKATNYTATNQDHNILVDATSGVVTITLPTAVTLAGQEFLIKDWKGQAATHNITIATTSAQTIDGASTKVISANYGSVRVVSDGSNWAII
jgi:hypothetical protein